MKPDYEQKLLKQLQEDEAIRQREKFVYTVDALLESFFLPGQVWPESNANVRAVVDGTTDYNRLPFDEDNEVAKGTAFPKQQEIVSRNQDSQPLCEARQYEPCRREECILYHASTNPPVCREFKIAFPKILKQ